MLPRTWRRLTAGILSAGVVLGGVACADESIASRTLAPIERAAAAKSANRTHTEFTGSQSEDIYFSCLDEVVHYEVTFEATVDVTTSATGVQSITFRGILSPGSFVLRANGVRYDVFAHAHSENHEIIGPVHIIEGAIPQIFRSADKEVLVSNFQYQLVLDAGGNVITTKFTGACP
jgi:hypothetical protein